MAWALDVAWAATADAASSGTVAFTYGSSVASGALLVCFTAGGHNLDGVVTGVSDSVNGAWTQFGQGSPVNSGGGGARAISGWYRLNSGAGTPVVTATFTAAVTNRILACGSYTGIATSSAFDVGAGQGVVDPGIGANTITTGATGTTAEANELAVAITVAAATNGVISAGTTLAWTERLSVTTVYDCMVEDINIPSTATVTATWGTNSTTQDYMSIVGTFKQLAAAGGTARQRLVNGGLIKGRLVA